MVKSKMECEKDERAWKKWEEVPVDYDRRIDPDSLGPAKAGNCNSRLRPCRARDERAK